MIKEKIQKDLKKIIIKNLKNTGVKPHDHLYLSVDMGGIFHNFLDQPEKIEMIYKNKVFFTKYVLKILKEFIFYQRVFDLSYFFLFNNKNQVFLT